MIRQSVRGYDMLPVDDLLFTEKRIVPLNGAINSEKAEEVITALLALEMTEPGKPIWLPVSGPGGGIDAGFAIIDVMDVMKSPVYTVAAGLTASMGAVILAAGEKGHRYALPHSRIMIHEPLIAGGTGGSATSIQRTAESILLTKQKINDLLARYTGRTAEEINAATSFDNFMSAEQAAEFGLCDKLLTDLGNF